MHVRVILLHQPSVLSKQRRNQPLLADPQPFFADEIVVRSSRLTILSERPDSSFALGREEIESLPHLGDDVARATSLLPGTAAHDVTAQFSVHGGRRDEVGVFLDGQELYDAYHLKDYDNALSLVAARTLSGSPGRARAVTWLAGAVMILVGLGLLVEQLAW